jgi:hypothetical protein
MHPMAQRLIEARKLIEASPADTLKYQSKSQVPAGFLAALEGAPDHRHCFSEETRRLQWTPAGHDQGHAGAGTAF